MSLTNRLKLLGESAVINDGTEQAKISLGFLTPAYFENNSLKHISDLRITKGKTPKDPVVFEFSLYLYEKSVGWKRKNISLAMSATAAEYFTPIAEGANVSVS